jgi:hypothetical protein
MLHPLLPVDCLPQMERLLAFQRGVLELGIEIACGNVACDEAGFKKVLKQQAGTWFWSKYTNNQNWCNGFNGYWSACQKNFSFVAAILPAFDNDILFQDYLADPNYHFLFPSLEPTLQAAIEQLFKFFYDYLGTTGYDDAIHGLAGFKLTRETFIKSHEKVNGAVSVCPVCDMELPDENNFELDHFFPKALYPFLSVHPYNLIPTCNKCNGASIKGKKNPLENNQVAASAGTFPNTYHPHKGRSIREMARILPSRSLPQQKSFLVEIEDTVQPPHFRVETAKKVFDLPNRWAKRMPNRVEYVVELIRHHAKHRNKSLCTIEQMIRDIEIDVKLFEKAHHSLLAAYLEFAKNSDEEKAFLYREYSNAPLFGR